VDIEQPVPHTIVAVVLVPEVMPLNGTLDAAPPEQSNVPVVPLMLQLQFGPALMVKGEE
jgi:hypothetical protein